VSGGLNSAYGALAGHVAEKKSQADCHGRGNQRRSGRWINAGSATPRNCRQLRQQYAYERAALPEFLRISFSYLRIRRHFA